MKLVPDTSALINRAVSERIQEGDWVGAEVIVPNAAVAELEIQANSKKEKGFVGLEEIKHLQTLASAGKIKLRFAGDRPSPEDIRFSRFGLVDAKIRDVALQEQATLVTADRVQADVAEAYGLKVIRVRAKKASGVPSFEEFFDNHTMSVHLRANVPPMAKKGKPGKFKLVKIRDTPMSEEDVKKIAMEIIERATSEPDAYIEREYEGATVVQYKNYRIVIAHPPFSDAWEITLVRPLIKATLDDYTISEKLRERLEQHAEGILIAGAPGAGKSTFAQALAEFYASKGKIVKTMESPRDLQVNELISQYAPLEGDMENTGDVLLLLRPDYTVYDEVRKTRDFEIFADMRMAGVGMIGVVHASNPIEAIQRFVRRLELGIIPQVVDTVIYIEAGDIAKVYRLDLVVKVPSGMKDDDLARPVVEVREFETNKLEFEIYTYGEETFVVPVSEEKETPLEQHAKRSIEAELERQLDVPFDVEVKKGRVVLYADPDNIPHIIGRGGTRISALEERIGLPIDVKPYEGMPETKGSTIRAKIEETPKYVVVNVGKRYRGKTVTFVVDEEILGSAKVNSKGIAKVKKTSPLGERLKFARRMGKVVEVLIE
ncbi:MAG: Flp pilus assembly complex ATPase component [Candidatus Diapherotrites archaeon]|nr:Flp pilus assembly complex ATPase component [Candidatus Diapherotrites archaeon]